MEHHDFVVWRVEGPVCVYVNVYLLAVDAGCCYDYFVLVFADVEKSADFSCGYGHYVHVAGFD